VKVYAQSSVPTHMPYLHVGYLAATTTGALGSGMFLMAVTLTAAGLLLLVKYLHVRKRIESFTLSMKPVRPAFTAGLALLGAGLLGFASLPFLPQEPAYPLERTEHHILQVSATLAEAVVAGKHPAEDVQALRAVSDLEEETTRDAWGRDFRIVRAPHDNDVVYIVTSAGRDGVFDTDDDIAVRPEDFLEDLAYFRAQTHSQAGAASPPSPSATTGK
jgi:hypothetical protein